MPILSTGKIAYKLEPQPYVTFLLGCYATEYYEPHEELKENKESLQHPGVEYMFIMVLPKPWNAANKGKEEI